MSEADIMADQSRQQQREEHSELMKCVHGALSDQREV